MSVYRALPGLKRRFVDLVAFDRMNGADAIRRLRKDFKRPQLKRPDVLAAKWRALPEIKAAITEREAAAIEEAGVTATDVLLGLAQHARGSIHKLFGADGRVLLPHELDAETARCIESVDIETTKDGGQRVKYRLPKRNEAYKLLGTHLKLFTERHEITGKDGDPIIPVTPTAIEIAKRIAFLLAAGSRDHPSDPAIGATQPAEQAPQQASKEES